jgi:sigma-E factor negative regulatory protein RseA
MNTKTSMQARISAFVDGELPESEIDAVLKDLQTPEGRAAWDTYHRIGDLARSQDMAVPISCDFAARMAQRLDAEPTILAPAAVAARAAVERPSLVRRFAAPAMAVAAMAALAFVVTPPVLKSMQSQPESGASAVVASSQPPLPHSAVIAAATQTDSAAGGVLRDVDTYVLAHQRVSPSVESSEHSAQEAAVGGVAK